jgi:signal transduction histidine kinase
VNADPASITADELARKLVAMAGQLAKRSASAAVDGSVHAAAAGAPTTVSVGEHGVSASGRHYRYYLIGEHASGVEEDAWHFTSSLPVKLAQADPDDPSFAEIVADVADEESIAILVVGPIEYHAIPLRAPASTSLADAVTLGEMLWPQYLFASQQEDDSGPYVTGSPFIELDEEAEALADGNRGLAFAIGMFEGFFDIRERRDPAPGQHPTPTMMFFAAWDDQALAEAGPTAPAVRAVQSSLARNLPWLLGALFALLALTLVASPLAVACEHRLETRARALEEMSRMRRDAHDRVFNRLSALSKQVSTAASGADTSASPRLARVAEEIRGAVGELQHILGEEGPHRGATLARQPLAVQLEQVCSAQASLLGVDVECAIGEGAEIPDVPAELGWDLQCITEEAITNAVRHGGANIVTAALAVDMTAGGATPTLVLTRPTTTPAAATRRTPPSPT